MRLEENWLSIWKGEKKSVIDALLIEQFNTTKMHFDKNRILEIALQITSEWQSVEDFIYIADQIGHVILNDNFAIFAGEFKWEDVIITLANIERMDQFNLIYEPLKVIFALAQHHGIPTRLLDWTYSPFIASFFAAQEAFEKKENDALAVWAINYKLLDKTDLKPLNHPKSKINFLQAQAALFIYDSKANSHFVETGYWRSFEEVLSTSANDINEPILRKITLPSSEAKELLRLLSAEGITKAHIMPTFDNVTETLKLKRKISHP